MVADHACHLGRRAGRRGAHHRACARSMGRCVQLEWRSRRVASAGIRRPGNRQPTRKPHHRFRRGADFLRSIDGPIVLVGHSYGGSVITNAAEGNSNVKALVYVDAAAPDVGETNGSLSGADSVLKHIPEDELFDTLPYPGAPAGAVDLYLKKDVFLAHFGNDLPADVATRLWASQRAASTAAFDTPSRYAAWKTIPSWYFISTGDQIITPTSERAMAARAHSTVTEFDGGSHLTLISHPEAVTAVILDA